MIIARGSSDDNLYLDNKLPSESDLSNYELECQTICMSEMNRARMRGD